MKLHLGCGKVVIPGWINVDKAPSTQAWEKVPTLVDKISSVDLRFSWPWPDSAVTHITISHFLGHLSSEAKFHVIQECFRVLQSGGLIRLTEDDNDNPRSAYHDKMHHNSVEKTSLDKIMGMFQLAGFSDVKKMTHNQTQSADKAIMLNSHSLKPSTFFLEASKPAS